jgi:hypothetical protein
MSKIMLKDAPGAERFIERCADAAKDLSLFFVGRPNDEMLVALNRTRENLKRDLADTLGAEVAGQIAEAFVNAVAGHKRELETNGGGSA